MKNFKQKLIAFMYGRYGVDELYYGLFTVWFVLVIVNMFARSSVIYLLETVALVYSIWRVLSRNYEKRRRENAAFLKIWKPVKNYLLYCKDRIRDIKTFRYRKCPKCRAIIKLPNKRGKHTTRCPKCGERFDVRIL